MKFSVIVVNEGPTEAHQGMLTRCLASIAQQTQRDIEVLVMGEKTLLPDERFRNIEADTRNVIAAKNLAASHAAGEWLLFINATSVLEEECIARLYAASLRFPDCALFAATQLDNAAPEMLAAAGISYFFAGFPFNGGKDWPLDVLPDEGECFGAGAAAFFIKKDVFDAAHGFDADFEIAGEDTDLSFRLRLAGHHAMLASEAVVFVTQSPRPDEYRISTRNTFWVFIKNMPDVLFYPIIPLHLFIQLLLLCNPLRFKSRILGIVDAFKTPCELWEKRAAVQATRKVNIETIARSFTWNLSKAFWLKPDVRRKK